MQPASQKQVVDFCPGKDPSPQHLWSLWDGGFRDKCTVGEYSISLQADKYTWRAFKGAGQGEKISKPGTSFSPDIRAVILLMEQKIRGHGKAPVEVFAAISDVAAHFGTPPKPMRAGLIYTAINKQLRSAKEGKPIDQDAALDNGKKGKVPISNVVAQLAGKNLVFV